VLYSPQAEWLETAGTGAFALGTVSRIRTRRYHTLLMHAASPSSGRRVLVPGFDAWLECRGKHIPLTRQRYGGDVIAPAQVALPSDFAYRPWPTWDFAIDAGSWREEFFISSTTGESILLWENTGLPAGTRFCVRLFLACRDYHALQARDDRFHLEPKTIDGGLLWRPYPDQPGITVLTNGFYTHEPYWYERFEYDEERARGFDHLEDLASPGVFSWTIGLPEARPVLVLRSFDKISTDSPFAKDTVQYAATLEQQERDRRERMPALDFSANQYLVRRGNGASIIAGYPWFTDWGRDTFIALRGLFIVRGKLDEARAVIETWASAMEDGLAPNRFADDGVPDYAAADTSLWFIIAAFEWSGAMRTARRSDRAFDAFIRLVSASILSRLIEGTHFGVHADSDGLLAAGEPGRALTWMDARVDGRVITPRIGKPVELQCLWVNALETARRRSAEVDAIAKAARRSFVERFWDTKRGYLADVVDVDHLPGTEDVSLRPNQIFAVGGLPRGLVPKRIGKKIVDAVARALYTPLGLRTLTPDDPAYVSRYSGGPDVRDGAYHQGTAWPWLMGAFGEAWLRVHGDTPAHRGWVQRNCIDPLRASLDTAGLGHIFEIADAGAPHTPRGCPFQAWSLGEFMRLERLCSEPKLPKNRLHAIS